MEEHINTQFTFNLFIVNICYARSDFIFKRGTVSALTHDRGVVALSYLIKMGVIYCGIVEAQSRPQIL